MKSRETAALLAIWILTMSACSPGEPAPAAPVPAKPAAAVITPPAPDVSKLPAGAYKIDPSHASLTFKVNHLGFAFYTAQFQTFTADLQLDPANPAAASVKAEIDLASLLLPNPPEGFKDEILGPNWLGAAQTPKMTFVSTGVTITGPATADIVGDLTLKGVTQPVTLHATFNGGYEGHPQDPHARIGFSAHGSLKRSAFGVSLGIPAPGSTMGVFDDVEIEIEAEFTGPALAGATPPV
jgi:polyisoprenoid-binding protein YceI